MKFLLCLVMFFLLVNDFTTAQSLIQDTCKKAAASNPKFKLDVCIKSLEENPQTKTAKTPNELTTILMQAATAKMTSVKGIVDKILTDNKFAKDSEMPLQDCLELYTEATDSLNEALASIKSGDFKTANQVLSAALNAPTTCESGFKEIETPQTSPVTIDNDDLYQMILIPLAFTNVPK